MSADDQALVSFRFMSYLTNPSMALRLHCGDQWYVAILRVCAKRGQVPLPERPAGCCAQRYLTPFFEPKQGR